MAMPVASSSSAAAVALYGLRACSSHGSATVCVRDPRVAPRSTQKNVTIPETCEFYGVKDAISGCRYPRSCRDCLAMEGCFLSTSGECKSMDEYRLRQDNAYDYRGHIGVTNSSFNSTQVYSSFVGGTASNCASDDAVCSKCIIEFQRLALPLHSASTRIATEFCVGSGGCVCVAVCEVSQLREQRVYDFDCGKPLAVLPGLSRTDNARDSLSSKRDPRSPRGTAFSRSEHNESCAFYGSPDIRGCRRPRTCHDCLQREGCAIQGYKCVDMNRYDWRQDYRFIPLGMNNNASATENLFVPSTNSTYCSVSDVVCTKCRQKFDTKPTRVNFFSVLETSEFCVGTNGCVCIEACESELWSQGVDQLECPRTVGRSVASVTGWTVLSVLTSLFAVGIAYGLYTNKLVPTQHRVRQAAQVVFRNMLDAVPPFRLDLFGWRGFHQRLIYKETQLLQGEEIVSPVAHPVDFMFVYPSAPDFEEDESSAPTASDPRALASAPVYRLDDTDEDVNDAVEPSAPLLEEADQNHLRHPRSNASGTSRHRSGSSSATEDFSELSMRWR